MGAAASAVARRDRRRDEVAGGGGMVALSSSDGSASEEQPRPGTMQQSAPPTGDIYGNGSHLDGRHPHKHRGDWMVENLTRKNNTRYALTEALAKAQAMSRQWEMEANAAAAAKAEAEAEAKAETARSRASKPSAKLRSIGKLRRRAPSPLDAGCADRRAASVQPSFAMVLVGAGEDPVPCAVPPATRPLPLDEAGKPRSSAVDGKHQEASTDDFCVLHEAPVLDDMVHGATQVDTLSARQLIEHAVICRDSSGGEWAYFDPRDPSRTPGWVSVLAPDGWTLQLGRNSDVPALHTFRALCHAPVLDDMLHGATQVDTLSEGALIERAVIRTDSRGGEWIKFGPRDPTRTPGWVSVLAPDGWTVQLGRENDALALDKVPHYVEQADDSSEQLCFANSEAQAAIEDKRRSPTQAGDSSEKELFETDRRRAAGDSEPLAKGPPTCILMTSKGRTWTRPSEIGEWYSAAGQAVKLEQLGSNRYKLLPNALLDSNGDAIDEIPGPEPEPEFTLQHYMWRESTMNFRALCNAPVLDDKACGATKVGTLREGHMIERQIIHTDSSGGKWVYFDSGDPSRASGWVSVLAPDGQTLQLGQQRVKFAESNSGRRQREAYSEMKKEKERRKDQNPVSTEDIVAKARAQAWFPEQLAWGSKLPESLCPCTNGHDNGCPNTRRIQEKTLKAVNVQPGDVILEVGFFLGETLVKTAERLAEAAAECDLRKPGRKRIEAANEQVRRCKAALEAAREVSTEAAAKAEEAAKQADEMKSKKEETDSLIENQRKAREKNKNLKMQLKIIEEDRRQANRPETEEERNKRQEHEQLIEKAELSAIEARQAVKKCKDAGEVLETAYKRRDHECIIGGGIGRVHGCEIEGRLTALSEYLSKPVEWSHTDEGTLGIGFGDDFPYVKKVLQGTPADKAPGLTVGCKLLSIETQDLDCDAQGNETTTTRYVQTDGLSYADARELLRMRPVKLRFQNSAFGVGQCCAADVGCDISDIVKNGGESGLDISEATLTYMAAPFTQIDETSSGKTSGGWQTGAQPELAPLPAQEESLNCQLERSQRNLEEKRKELEAVQAKMFEFLSKEVEWSYGGDGAVGLDFGDDFPYVKKVLQGTPADKAPGLTVGCKLLSIETQDLDCDAQGNETTTTRYVQTDGLSYADARELLRMRPVKLRFQNSASLEELQSSRSREDMELIRQNEMRRQELFAEVQQLQAQKLQATMLLEQLPNHVERKMRPEGNETNVELDEQQEISQDGGHEIFISHLPKETTEAELSQFFGQCGDIVDAGVDGPDRLGKIEVLRDKATGQCRGFAFITFKTEHSMQMALSKDGDEFGGQRICISVGTEGTLHTSWTTEQLTPVNPENAPQNTDEVQIWTSIPHAVSAALTVKWCQRGCNQESHLYARKAGGSWVKLTKSPAPDSPSEIWVELPASVLEGEGCDIGYRVVGLASEPRLPYEDNTFDKAYSIGALHFWPHLPSALDELRRVLKPQGTLVLALQPLLIAAGQQFGCLPGGTPWDTDDILLALYEAGFSVETPDKAERFTLTSDTDTKDQAVAAKEEKEERLKLAQQHDRAAEERNLKQIPDSTINYIHAPCYRTVYCTCCRAWVGSGERLFQPAGNSPPPNPRPSYQLALGPTTCECLLPMLDDSEVGELQLEVTHPWSSDALVTHVFAKQEFPPVDLGNHPVHPLPVKKYTLTTEQTEQLLEKLSTTNKRAMQITVKVYAVELDYHGNVNQDMERSLLGSGTVDLGVYLLNTAAQSEGGLSEGQSEGKQPDASYQLKLVIESATASRNPIARVALDFRADASAWSAAYVWRLRNIYYPAHETVYICKSCHQMAMSFQRERAEIIQRWVIKGKERENRAEETRQKQGRPILTQQGRRGVGLDFVILTACPLQGRVAAAKSLDRDERLSENFLMHIKDVPLEAEAEFYPLEQAGGSRRWAPMLEEAHRLHSGASSSTLRTRQLDNANGHLHGAIRGQVGGGGGSYVRNDGTSVLKEVGLTDDGSPLFEILESIGVNGFLGKYTTNLDDGRTLTMTTTDFHANTDERTLYGRLQWSRNSHGGTDSKQKTETAFEIVSGTYKNETGGAKMNLTAESIEPAEATSWILEGGAYTIVCNEASDALKLNGTKVPQTDVSMVQAYKEAKDTRTVPLEFSGICEML